MLIQLKRCRLKGKRKPVIWILWESEVARTFYHLSVFSFQLIIIEPPVIFGNNCACLFFVADWFGFY